jgi:hypothetical protein
MDINEEKIFMQSCNRKTTFLDAISSNLVNMSVLRLLEQSESVVRHLVERVTLNELEIEVEVVNKFLSQFLGFNKLSDSIKSKIIMQPSFHYWLRVMRRILITSDTKRIEKFVLDFSSLVWIEVIEQLGSTINIKLDSYGGLRCLRYSRFLEFGKPYANAKGFVTKRESDFVFSFEDGLNVIIPEADIKNNIDDPAPSIEKHGYFVNEQMLVENLFTVSSRDEYLRVKYTGTNQRRDGVDFFDIVDDDYENVFHAEKIASCLQLIKKAWPDQFHDLGKYTKVAVPRTSGPNLTIAFTVSSRQGAIFLDDIDSIRMAENIIHENAHVKLRYLQLIDTVLEDFSDDEAKYIVSWRKDPRPLPGILEGVYVFSHVAEFYVHLYQVDAKLIYLSRAQQILDDLSVASDILKNNAKFTLLGRILFDEVTKWKDQTLSSLAEYKMTV